jgi:hypothetical protein
VNSPVKRRGYKHFSRSRGFGAEERTVQQRQEEKGLLAASAVERQDEKQQPEQTERCRGTVGSAGATDRRSHRRSVISITTTSSTHHIASVVGLVCYSRLTIGRLGICLTSIVTVTSITHGFTVAPFLVTTIGTWVASTLPIATLVTICTLHPCTGVIFAGIAITDTLVTTESSALFCTGIFDALAFFATLAILTGHTITGICLTLTFFADFTAGTGGTIGNALAIGGTTGFSSTALFVFTRVVFAGSVGTQLFVCTGRFVTSRRCTFVADTNSVTGTIHIDVAGFVTRTLAVVAGLSFGTIDITAGITSTFLPIADTTVTTGVLFTGIFDALAVTTGFVSLTSDFCTGVPHTIAIHTLFTSLAEHT